MINKCTWFPMACSLLVSTLRHLKSFSPFWESCVYCKDQIRCKMSKATSDFVNIARDQEEMQSQMPSPNLFPTFGVDANSSRLFLWLLEWNHARQWKSWQWNPVWVRDGSGFDLSFWHLLSLQSPGLLEHL